jgi:hypothetical protein
MKRAIVRHLNKHMKKFASWLFIILLNISNLYAQDGDQFIHLAFGNLQSSANRVAWMLDFGKIGFDSSSNCTYVAGKDS